MLTLIYVNGTIMVQLINIIVKEYTMIFRAFLIPIWIAIVWGITHITYLSLGQPIALGIAFVFLTLAVVETSILIGEFLFTIKDKLSKKLG